MRSTALRLPTSAITFLTALVLMAPLASPAAGQISKAAGNSNAVLGGLAGGVIRGSASAHDPVNNVRLVVGAHGDVHGVFVGGTGAPVTAPFAIWPGTSGFGQFPTATFSAGIGGGGFLVTWNASTATPPYVNSTYGRIVTYTQSGYLASDIFLLSDSSTFAEVGAAPAVAYSPATNQFLVAWQTTAYEIRGRLLSVGSLTAGPVFAISTGNAQYPSVAYNPTNGQFGVGYSGFGGSGATSTFALVSAAGTVLGRNTFNIATGTFITDMAVNPTTGRYVMTWSQGDGTRIAEFAADGSVLGVGAVSTSIGGYDSGSLAYNSTSGTFLVVGHGQTGNVAATELSSRGNRFTAVVEASESQPLSGSFYPRVSSSTQPSWMTTFSRDFTSIQTHIVSTTSTNGGDNSALPAPGAPPPPPTGGGTTPPPPTGCTTASPGEGWTCVNGGWLPPSGGGSTTPPPTTGGCTGTAPFPGAVCVNGGWVPGTGGTTGGCTTASPGTGWTCVNGGWQPPTSTGGSTGGSSSCPGTAPFPGAVCQNGGWVPGGGTGGSTGGGTAPPPQTSTTGVNADYNRDGKSELIFQNIWGQLMYRQITGTTLTGEGMLSSATVNGVFRVVATGDLTGDGHADVLWQDTTNGQAYLNIMQGAAIIGQQAITSSTTTSRIVGTGDVDNDGHLDIIWHNAGTGRVYVWFMRPRPGPHGFAIAGNAGPNNTHSGGFIVEGTGTPLSIGGASWRVGGLGDFNNDSRVDLAWQNEATGELRVWYLNGTIRYYNAAITTVADLNWRLAAIGDFTGDTKLDVVWQHTNGAMAVYTLTGSSLVETIITPGGIDPDWRLIGPK